MQLFASVGYEATAQDDTKKKFFGVSVDERPTLTVGLKQGANSSYVSDMFEDKLVEQPSHSGNTTRKRHKVDQWSYP